MVSAYYILSTKLMAHGFLGNDRFYADDMTATKITPFPDFDVTHRWIRNCIEDHSGSSQTEDIL
jgi:hypothetical protein